MIPWPRRDHEAKEHGWALTTGKKKPRHLGGEVGRIFVVSRDALRASEENHALRAASSQRSHRGSGRVPARSHRSESQKAGQTRASTHAGGTNNGLIAPPCRRYGPFPGSERGYQSFPLRNTSQVGHKSGCATGFLNTIGRFPSFGSRRAGV